MKFLIDHSHGSESFSEENKSRPPHVHKLERACKWLGTETNNKAEHEDYLRLLRGVRSVQPTV